MITFVAEVGQLDLFGPEELDVGAIVDVSTLLPRYRIQAAGDMASAIKKALDHVNDGIGTDWRFDEEVF